MKKQVLLSVFAAALFAAPAVSAFDLPNVDDVATHGNTDKPVENLGELKASADKGLEEKAVGKTEKANGLKAVKTEDGYKFVGKGKVAPAKKAVKALPKTSAVK